MGRNAICDVCGFKYPSEKLRRRWDGAMVCRDDWEPQHPIDRPQPPRVQQAPAWTRPDSETFTSVIYDFVPEGLDAMGTYCQADYATADFAEVDNINGSLII